MGICNDTNPNQPLGIHHNYDRCLRLEHLVLVYGDAMITLSPHKTSSNYRKVTCDCKPPFECDAEICNTHSINYLLGVEQPNYPLPAIPLTVKYQNREWRVYRLIVPWWYNDRRDMYSSYYLHKVLVAVFGRKR